MIRSEVNDIPQLSCLWNDENIGKWMDAITDDSDDGKNEPHPLNYSQGGPPPEGPTGNPPTHRVEPRLDRSYTPDKAVDVGNMLKEGKDSFNRGKNIMSIDTITDGHEPDVNTAIRSYDRFNVRSAEDKNLIRHYFPTHHPNSETAKTLAKYSHNIPWNKIKVTDAMIFELKLGSGGGIKNT